MPSSTTITAFACVALALGLAVLAPGPEVAAIAVIGALPGLRALVARVRGASPSGLEAVLDGEAPLTALARLDGEVVAHNRPTVGAVGEAGDIVALLGRVIDCDEALVYRMTRSAVRVGFALSRSLGHDGAEVHLSATRIDDDHIAWRLLGPDDLRNAVLSGLADPYEEAPFAYLRSGPAGAPRANHRFRERFAPDVADHLATAAPRTRMRLVDRDGVERVVRVFTRESERGDTCGRETFLFDLADEDDAPVSTRDLDDLPIAVLHLSGEGRVLWRNAAAGRLLGPGAGVGAAFETLVESRARALAVMMHQARQPGEVQIENVQFGERALRLSLSPSRGGEGGRLVAVLSDESELQALRDKYTQSQKMEAVGKLAGGVAHDFNNLITAINGHCDLLMIGKDATRPEYSDLMQIRQNANRAAALVRQLLAFSRKQTLNPELLSVSDVLSDTMYLLDRLIGDRVTLHLDPDPAGPVGQVRADHRQLEQALMNLVVNARDAMPAGGAVTISTRRRQFRVEQTREGGVIPPGDYVELAVADEGTGIHPDVLGKVFDPFFTTKAQGEGTGLGLSTVYGIVQQSGGLIFAENRPEGGACFRILLPRSDPGVADEVRPERRPAAAVDLTGRGSVLLVEDEAAVRSFAARALTLRGYEVSAAEEAEEALALIEDGDKDFDLIVSDVMMPGMDGPTFVSKARALRPGVRVLFVSGYAEAAFLERLDDTSYAFLAKPFSLAELTAKVKEVLSEPSQAA